jgi:hypothetical protein
MESPTTTIAKKRNFIWPSVRTADDAKWATKQAFQAAVFVSAVTSLLSLLGAAQIQFARDFGANAWSLLDAASFAAVAWGLKRDSRVAAWAGLVLYSVGSVLQPSPLRIILILVFISGVRGASALHVLGREARETQSPIAA